MSVNILSVLCASIAAFILQFIINGPLFGKVRAQLGNTNGDTSIQPSHLPVRLFLNLVVNFITAYVIAVVYTFATASAYIDGNNIWRGIACALLLWFGVFITATSIDVIWAGKSIKLWLFEALAAALVFAAMGAVVGFMM